MTERRLTAIDRLLLQADRALRTLSPGSARPQRANPAQALQEAEMSDDERRHVAGLMRVDHCGEVCAQALYQGQALTAKLPAVRTAMTRAADEEIDHLAWCEQRLKELDSHTSVLNPAFYAASFTIGAVAGFIGDNLSLGFVAATEQQVCAHLDSHLKQLPKGDEKSRAILRQMRSDEAEHATGALAAGGLPFPLPVRRMMSTAAQVMTRTTYYF